MHQQKKVAIKYLQQFKYKQLNKVNINKTTTFITTALMLFSITAFSQTKEETVKYINDLYKKTHKHSEFKIEKVVLDGKVLQTYFSDGDSYRRELMKFKSLQIRYDEYDLIYRYSIWVWDSTGKDTLIFSRISTEEDAKRLKNALEHLIKIVEDEPETDPFAPK